MSRRLLLVEPSATMRHVLEKHVRALGHEVESTDSYAAAHEALGQQYRAFGSDIVGVLFGWPTLPDEDADVLSAALESDDFADVPVVVLSTDMRAETRAWVAGRERTAVLAWKRYLGVDALLERLLDERGDVPGERVAKFDNADIHLLVVDDSLTIRHALRDLFERHGYRVGLAATRDEALAAARETRFDIAVLDFFLEDSTGDALCRDLVSDPACGEIVCAILTGTYADHVIKRSLRAGAVECMFKNESSELLLTRIDRIARFVRQRRALSVGLGRLERVVETLAGAVLVVDADGRVRHVTRTALAELGLTALDPVNGQSATALLGVERLPEEGGRPVAMTWRDATGRSFAVDATRLALAGSGESLLGFVRREEASSEILPTASPSAAPPPSAEEGDADGTDTGGTNTGGTGADGRTVGSLAEPDAPDDPGAGERTGAGDVESGAVAGQGGGTPPDAHGLPADAAPFVARLERYVAAGAAPDRVSLLALDVHRRGEDGTTVPVSGALAASVEAGLARLYRHEHHVSALGGSRFGVLIRHADAPQSYLLTRRLMQLCNEMLTAAGGPPLASSGCLIGLDEHPGRAPRALLDHALRGLGVIEGRGLDQALLLDLKRLLAVYPASPAGDASNDSNAVPTAED